MTTAIGPVLGGWLIDAFSWRWVFFINVPIAVIVLIVSARRVRESRDEEAGTLDLPGALAATAGLAGLTWGLLESSERGFGDFAILSSIAAGTALLLLFLAMEARAPSPMLPLRLFRSRTFSGANLLTLFLYAALSGALFFFPLDLVQVHGYSATAAGAAFLPFILLVSVLSRWSGGLVGRYGARLPLVFGSLIAAGGYLLFSLPADNGSYWTTFFPAVTVLGLGMAISVAPLTTAVMNAVPTRQAGTASGINNACARIAGLLAIALAGILMVAIYSSELSRTLDATGVPAAVRDALLGQRSSLAGTRLPPTLDPVIAQRATEAIDRAFVAGFRAVMVAAALLATISAITAWLTIDPDRRPMA
jgi:MFS family permease